MHCAWLDAVELSEGMDGIGRREASPRFDLLISTTLSTIRALEHERGLQTLHAGIAVTSRSRVCVRTSRSACHAPLPCSR